MTPSNPVPTPSNPVPDGVKPVRDPVPRARPNAPLGGRDGGTGLRADRLGSEESVPPVRDGVKRDDQEDAMTEPMVTEAFRRKVSEGLYRHWADPEKSAKHRAAVSGPQSEETRRKKSEGARRMWERRRAAQATTPGDVPATPVSPGGVA